MSKPFDPGSDVVSQTEALPSTYNADEKERKEETEKQLVKMGKKIDRILQIIDGEGAVYPGLVSVVSAHQKTLFGKDEQPGLVQTVNILTKFKSWVTHSLTAAITMLATLLASYAMKHL